MIISQTDRLIANMSLEQLWEVREEFRRSRAPEQAALFRMVDAEIRVRNRINRDKALPEVELLAA